MLYHGAGTILVRWKGGDYRRELVKAEAGQGGGEPYGVGCLAQNFLGCFPCRVLAPEFLEAIWILAVRFINVIHIEDATNRVE